MKAWKITIWLETEDSVGGIGSIEDAIELGCLSNLARTSVDYHVEELLYG